MPTRTFTLTSTGYSTNYEIPENHIVSSVQIVVGTAAGRLQGTNEQTPTNWSPITAATTANQMYDVGYSYRHIRAASTSYTTGNVVVMANLVRTY